MKNNIKITTQVTYLQQQSNVSINRYVYAYMISIVNYSSRRVQLLSRHWKIMDENGTIKEVIGEGVIGQQPYIYPNDSFQYSSSAIIKTPTGSMQGTYTFIDDEAEIFKTLIPGFTLSDSYALH